MKIISNKKDEYLKDYIGKKFYINAPDNIEYAKNIVNCIFESCSVETLEYLNEYIFVIKPFMSLFVKDKISVTGYFAEKSEHEDEVLIPSKDFYNRFLNKENWNKIDENKLTI